MKRSGKLLPLTAVLILGLSSLVLGEDDPADRKGFFISIAGQTLEPRGDFGSGLTLWHFDKAFFVPALERGAAFGLAAGFRRESSLWEFNIERSSFRGVLDGAAHETGLTGIELNGWGIPWKHIALQPYYLLGLSFSLMSVADGARLNGLTSDATYSGFGLNVGGGVLANLGKRLFLSGGVKYRFLWFFYVNGGGRGRDITHLTVGRNGPTWGKWLSATSLGLSFSLGVLL